MRDGYIVYISLGYFQERPSHMTLQDDEDLEGRVLNLLILCILAVGVMAIYQHFRRIYYAVRVLGENNLSCRIDNPPSFTPNNNQATPQIHRGRGKLNKEAYSRVKVTGRDGYNIRKIKIKRKNKGNRRGRGGEGGGSKHGNRAKPVSTEVSLS